MAGKDGLENLSRLLGAKTEREREPVEDADEEKLLQDADKLLKQAHLIAGRDASIFDVQLLVDTAATVVRDQIREMVEEDEDE